MSRDWSTEVAARPVSIDEDLLADLRMRLRNTRWPSDFDNDDWSYGVNRSYLQALAESWADFDWRPVEQRLNQFEHFRVEIDKVPIHFMYREAAGPRSIPVILTHGWPWTFWDWSKVVLPLADPGAFGGDPADAFDVIVPSLPGYGFSNPLPRGDLNFWKIADLWERLMTDYLRYPRYAAAGSDMGALVTEQLGHKFADHLYGIHLQHAIPLDIFQSERPWDLTAGQLVPPDASPEARRQILQFQRNFAAHAAAHMLDSQTLAYAFNDSPVGVLAWILERWRNWSACEGDVERVYSREDLLTRATIWWATESIGPSMRSYANIDRYRWHPSHGRSPQIEAPAGFTFLGDEAPIESLGMTPADAERAFRRSPAGQPFNIVYTNVHQNGGHFGPWENPSAFVQDIRATFRGLR